MSDPWEHLRESMANAVDWIWSDFAKEGLEGTILRSLGEQPGAAAWIAESLGMSDDCICRKLSAMLAGWIFDADHASLVPQMLDRERSAFSSMPLDANSIAEDIMFGATRWSTCDVPVLRETGSEVLATMVRDALHQVPWNTVHWAAANLYAVAGKGHPALIELTKISNEKIADQRFLVRTAEALRTDDQEVLSGYHTEPNSASILAPEHPRFQEVNELWDAASKAQAELVCGRSYRRAVSR